MKRPEKSRPGALTPEEAFAKALREVRTEHGVSQEDLAFDSSYHRTYIGQLERGKMNPSLRTILSIAAVLDVPAAEIVRRVEAHLGKPWKRPEKERVRSGRVGLEGKGGKSTP
jgi:transcriptional regulator with XRE-family HTH domain